MNYLNDISELVVGNRYKFVLYPSKQKFMGVYKGFNKTYQETHLKLDNTTITVQEHMKLCYEEYDDSAITLHNEVVKYAKSIKKDFSLDDSLFEVNVSIELKQNRNVKTVITI